MNDSTERKTLTEIVLFHFDEFQRRDSIQNDTDDIASNMSSPKSYVKKSFTFDSRKASSRTEAEMRVMMMRKEISHFKRVHRVDEGKETNEISEKDHGLSEMMSNLEINKTSKETQEEILNALLHCVNTAFLVAAQNIKSMEESIHCILELAAAFGCAIDSKDGYIYDGLLQHVAKFILSQEDVIRAKACALFGYSLTYLLSLKSSAVAFRESSLDFIFKLLNPRLLDKAQIVRLTASKACGAIALTNTNPSLADLVPEYMILSLINNTKHDSSFAVRTAALQSLPLQEDTLPIVVGRIRDIKEKVRVEALHVLMSRKGADVIQDLSLDDRLNVLRNGLRKRCKNTYEKTLQLLCTNWLKSVKFDPIELLRLLDPCDAENESICENTVRSIVSVAWEENEKVANATLKELSSPEIRAFRENVELITTSINEEKLDAARALYLRVKCTMIEKSTQISDIQKQQQIQNIFVDVPTLCEVLMSHIEKFTTHMNGKKENRNEIDEEESENIEESECSVCLQLLKLSRFTDLQEEGSRRHFFSIIRDILISLDTPDILIESCLQVMILSHNDETEFVKDIADILKNILSSSAHNNEMNTIETQMMASSTETKLRMANILLVVLEKVARTNTEDGTLNSFHSLIMPMVTSENITIREAGVSCLGKFALLSTEMDVVEQFQSILLKLASNPREKNPVRAQAALSLCDLAVLFQPECSEVNPMSKLQESLMGVINTMMNYQDDVMVIIAAEICVKLMISNKLHNADILSKLLMMHFDTNFFADSLWNEDEGVDDVADVGSPVRLLQMLSIFFPAYSMTNDSAQNSLIASLRPFLVSASKRIKEKKAKSAVLNAKKIVGYICSLVDAGIKGLPSNDESKSKENISNDKVMSTAIIIAETMFENHSDFSKTYSRGLCSALGGTIGSLDGAEVDEKLYDILNDTIDHLEGIIDDEKIIDEIQEIHEVIHSMKKSSSNEESKENHEEEEIVESLNHVTLQDDSIDNRNSRDSTGSKGLRRSSRTSRKSTESTQSFHSLHSEATATRSSKTMIDNNSELSPIANCNEESPQFDVENGNILPNKLVESLHEEVEEGERRCLAPLNQ